jgi:micrococcal nuclease
MWYRHWPYAACFVIGIAFTLLVQVSWRYGRPRLQNPAAQLDLSLQTDKVYRVLRVIDGDTLTLENGLHIRYAGINTPEKGRFISEPAPLSEAATIRNRQLVEGRNVRLRVADTPVDAYGRVVAHVVALNPDGTETDVEATLLKEGLGRLMALSLAHDEYGRLKGLQEEARSSRLGIWGASEGSVKKEGATVVYCAASGGKVFHRSDCPQAKRIAPANLVFYEALEDVRASGRHSCRQCLSDR